MFKKTYYCVVALFIIFIFFCITKQECEAKMKISKTKAIKIANLEAKRLGFDIIIMKIKTTKYNTPWNDYLQKDTNDEYQIEKINQLKDKEYWAIYYYPNREIVGMSYKGGDFCIFVDANSGKIITIIQWK